MLSTSVKKTMLFLSEEVIDLKELGDFLHRMRSITLLVELVRNVGR